MIKKLILPVVGVATLVAWVALMFYANQNPTSNFTRGGPDMEWLGRLLLFFSPFCLVAGSVAGLLIQYGARLLRTDSGVPRRGMGIVPILGGVGVWLATACFILLGAALLATG